MLDSQGGTVREGTLTVSLASTGTYKVCHATNATSARDDAAFAFVSATTLVVIPYTGSSTGALVGGFASGAATVCLLALVLSIRSLYTSRKRKANVKAESEAAKRAEAEAAPVRAECEKEAEAKECSFWWVNAKALRESKDVTLPKFQELRKREGFLSKKKITRRSSVQGAYTAEYLTISHRWLGEGGKAPDPSGTQLDAIRKYLRAHPDIKWVWFECVLR